MANKFFTELGKNIDSIIEESTKKTEEILKESENKIDTFVKKIDSFLEKEIILKYNVNNFKFNNKKDLSIDYKLVGNILYVVLKNNKTNEIDAFDLDLSNIENIEKFKTIEIKDFFLKEKYFLISLK